MGELAPQHPEWKTTPPFNAILAGNREAVAKFITKDIEVIAMATHTGMTPEAFQKNRAGLVGEGKTSTLG